ncbi:Dynein heavy chain 1, axonemal [Perkinsus olseni]|uniref:Dynein heavy chain 1, axonemal n=2 Tax=Perkinsus olseni TaxID=32597 RepID=A0A7J6PQL1_PEROL|nr:Dynein heavy chain 1, axonemal [Perkinsus olseni]
MSGVAEEVLSKVPPLFDMLAVEEAYPPLYEESMNTVLRQEVLRYNRLLNEIRSTVPELQKALKGLVVMSESLEKMGNAFLTNQVPEAWSDRGFLSLKPLSSWISDLIDRVTFMEKWVRSGVPPAFWISGLFFPQAFLTGTLQNFSRAKKVAIDRLAFDFTILDDREVGQITERASEGVYVYGIFLEGCRWDSTTHLLAESLPKELFCELPPIHFLPVVDREQPKSILQCPIYKVVSRRGTLLTTGHSTNFVLYIDIPSDREEDIWVRAGAAGFLALKT